MDIQTIWLLALAIATPVAGVVGFAIQITNVKQARLENEKLQLEIAALKTERVERERLVRLATTEEILLVRRGGQDSDVMYSRRGPDPGPDEEPKTLRNGFAAKISEIAVTSAFLLLALAIVGYLLYDIYRLGRWVLGLLGVAL